MPQARGSKSVTTVHSQPLPARTHPRQSSLKIHSWSNSGCWIRLSYLILIVALESAEIGRGAALGVVIVYCTILLETTLLETPCSMVIWLLGESF
jgi:hypothetical protein